MEGENEARFTEDDDGKKEGSDALNYAALADAGEFTAYCLRESKAFDKYCHQYNAKPNKAPRYADFTDGSDDPTQICAEWVDDDGAATTESVYCLAQDCMFDYCLWRRDEQLERCEEFVAEWDAATFDDAGEDLCAPNKRKFGVCLKTTVNVTVGEGESEYTGKNIRAAQKKTGNKRPGWGNVYNYNNMHDDLDTNAATEGDFESAVCTEYYARLDDLEQTY